MRYYIATALERADEHRRLREHLDSQGHECTYDWTTHGSVQGKGEAVMGQTADDELYGVEQAELVIVLLPGGRGTHVELGAALASTARILIVAAGDEALRGKDGRHCAFYFAHGVERYLCSDPIEAVDKYLSGASYDRN